MDELTMLQKIEEDLEYLKQEVKNLSYKLNYVEVKNGGGMSLKLKRDEFFQNLYDKPTQKEVITIVSKAVKNAPINSIRTIARDITLIIGMVIIILKLFGVLN